MKVLAGDVGGSKTVLMTADVHGRTIDTIVERRFPSPHYDSFTAILDEFLEDTPAGEHHNVCFAVAGPITEHTTGIQEAAVTNLPWKISTHDLCERYGFQQVRLINDFTAVGYGIDALTEHDLAFLQNTTIQPHGNRAILGAGTGLGMAQMIWTGSGYTVLPSEGGHCDFAAIDHHSQGLWSYLHREWTHVSYDRIVSGPGIRRIFDYYVETHRLHGDAWVKSIQSSDDPAAAISQAAESVEIAAEVMKTFVRLYGAEAGNLALLTLPKGGLYIAGGIAPKILSWLKTPYFIESFRAKGRMSALVARFPVMVITDTRVGLKGAALHAATEAVSTPTEL